MTNDTGVGDVVSTIRRYIDRTFNRPGAVGDAVGVVVPLVLWCIFGAASILIDGLHISRLVEWWYGVDLPPVRTVLAYLAGVGGIGYCVCSALAARLLRAADHTGGGEVIDGKP